MTACFERLEGYRQGRVMASKRKENISHLRFGLGLPLPRRIREEKSSDPGQLFVCQAVTVSIIFREKQLAAVSNSRPSLINNNSLNFLVLGLCVLSENELLARQESILRN
jgi:hypothetical protein